MSNKVLVATYTHKVKYYCIEDWLKNTKRLMDNFPDSDLLIVDNSDEKNSPAWLRLKMDQVFGKGNQTMLWINTVGKNSRFKQVESQRVLWEYALNNNYEKLFVLESDVFPKDPKTIQKLYSVPKQIVSGVFPLWIDEKTTDNDVLCIMGYGFNADLKRFWYHRFLWERAIKGVGKSSPIKVFACGLGCIMISREVLENIKPEIADEKLAKDLMKLLFKIDSMKTKSNLKKWLQVKVKGLLTSQEMMIKEKIHSDTNFHQSAELFNIPRYVLPEILCEHRRIEWKEIEKTVKR
jgi:hypothetical protein